MTRMGFVERHPYDDLRCQNQPAFYAYDPGVNIEMPVSDSEASQRSLDGQDSSGLEDDTWSARTHESPC